MGNSQLIGEPLYPEGWEEHLPDCPGRCTSDPTRYQDSLKSHLHWIVLFVPLSHALGSLMCNNNLPIVTRRSALARFALILEFDWHTGWNTNVPWRNQRPLRRPSISGIWVKSSQVCTPHTCPGNTTSLHVCGFEEPDHVNFANRSGGPHWSSDQEKVDIGEYFLMTSSPGFDIV